MGDLLSALALIIVAVGSVFFGTMMAQQIHRKKVLEHTPVPALDPSAGKRYFAMAQSETRILEALLHDDLVRPLIPLETCKEMKRLVDRFYAESE